MIFDKYKNDYTPKIWAYGLSLYLHQRIIEPFSKGNFEKALEVESTWDDIWSSLPYEHVELTDDQVENQLRFMGYISDKNFKYHDLYAYVSSNKKINGHWFILNKKFVDNYNSMLIRPSYPYIYDTWQDYALEGYTTIVKHHSLNQ